MLGVGCQVLGASSQVSDALWPLPSTSISLPRPDFQIPSWEGWLALPAGVG